MERTVTDAEPFWHGDTELFEHAVGVDGVEVVRVEQDDLTLHRPRADRGSRGRVPRHTACGSCQKSAFPRSTVSGTVIVSSLRADAGDVPTLVPSQQAGRRGSPVLAGAGGHLRPGPSTVMAPGGTKRMGTIEEPFGLQGRVAVVCGGARGIGRGAARKCSPAPGRRS